MKALLFILAAFPLLYPGSVPFLGDEAQLMLKAWKANEAGVWVAEGLVGTVGVFYGPLPTWIYQVCLKITSSLLWVVFLKTLLTQTFTLVSFLGLAKTLQWDLRPLLLIFLSPFLYFYARIPWDNCFLIPFSSLFLWQYVTFLLKGSSRSLFWVVFLGFILTLIHLMSLMALLPCGLFLLVNRFHSLKNRIGTLAFAFILGGSISFPYYSVLLQSVQSGSVSPPFTWESLLLGSLFGVRFFSTAGFFEYFLPSLAFKNASHLKWLVGISILGSTVGALYFFKTLYEMERKNEYKISILGVMIASAFFYFYKGLSHQPHYLNATWGFFFLILWKGYHELFIQKKSLLFKFHAFSLGFCLFLFVVSIEQGKGISAPHYGPTLEKQIAAIKFPETKTGEIDAHFKTYPQVLAVLQSLY